MKTKIAAQIAKLVNDNNNLTIKLSADKVLRTMASGNAMYTYLADPNDPSRVVACLKVTSVSWYQYEISHVSVDSDFRGQGIATMLLMHALVLIEAAQGMVAQCTIVNGNTASEKLFEKCGFVAGVSFYNHVSGNIVTVWQRTMSAVPSEEEE